jgi:peptide deformylase
MSANISDDGSPKKKAQRHAGLFSLYVTWFDSLCYHKAMAEILPITRFGNPLLRQRARRLSDEEILSAGIQKLIENMRHTLVEKKYGVGIAAPQVGKSVALSVIGVKPTPNRPELEPFDTVLINPEVVETFGEPVEAWEGCVSCGTDDDILFAKLPRYERLKVRWIDEYAKSREELIGGFVAQIIQHETDHLNGVLFVDRVTDPTSYMMADEYRQRIIGK